MPVFMGFHFYSLLELLKYISGLETIEMGANKY